MIPLAVPCLCAPEGLATPVKPQLETDALTIHITKQPHKKQIQKQYNTIQNKNKQNKGITKAVVYLFCFWDRKEGNVFI